VTKSRRKGWGGEVLGMWDRRGACRVFVEKPEGKRTLGSSRRKWQTNTKNIS
jgi:hypothetical protein